MSGDGLGNISMFANKPINFGISASDYVPTPTSLRLSENMNDYSNMFGRYTDLNGVITGNTPSKAAFSAVDVTKAPAVFNEKGLFDWSINEAGKIGSTADTEPGMFDKTMDFLGSDSMKGLGTLTGIGTDIWGISNTRKAQKQAQKQWEAENSRANEIMAMNREKYDTYKADKSRLNSQYA